MKKLIAIGIVTFLIAAVITAYIFQEQILKTGLTILITNLVGAPVSIDNIEVENGGLIYLYDLKIYNPEGFEKGVMMDLSSLIIKYDSIDLENKRVPLDFIDIDLNQMNVIRNKEGVLNIDKLKFVTCTDEEREKFYKTFPIAIMEMSIKRVVYTDHTWVGEGPFVSTFDIMIQDKIYEDIPDFTSLMIIIFHEAIGETVIKGAAFYGLVAVAGVGFWPLGVGLLVAGNDSASFGFDTMPTELYIKSVDAVKRIGGSTKKAKRVEGGIVIDADIGGHAVTIKIRDDDFYLSKMTVHARKFLIPSPGFAKNVLYEISQVAM